MQLPKGLEWPLAQTKWAGILNPFLAKPSLNNNLLMDLVLASGVNVINHKLGRAPIGWRVVDINGIATLNRSAPLNDLTLTLTSSAAVTISLEVF